MKGEQRLRQYLQGTHPGDTPVHDDETGGYVSSVPGALDDASADWSTAMSALEQVITHIENHTPAIDAFGDARTGQDAHHAFVATAKMLRERKKDFKKVTEALALAGGAVTYGHQKLDGLPVATNPGPKPPDPVNTNDIDPVMNMQLARWYGNKAKYDNNPALRDNQADAAADQMDTQFQAAIDKISGISAPKAPGSVPTGGGGPSGGPGSTAPTGSGPTPGTPHTPTYTVSPTVTPTHHYTAPTLSHHAPVYDPTQHHIPSGGDTGDDGSGGYDYSGGDDTTGGYDDGSLDGGGTPYDPNVTAYDPTGGPGGPGVPGAPGVPGVPGGPGGAGRLGGSIAAGGLGAGGLAAGMRIGPIEEPTIPTGALSRGAQVKPLGASSRAAGSAVTGRGTSAAGAGGTGARGAAVGGGHGSGRKDRKKGGPFSSYDDGSDWLDEDEAGPDVLR